MAHIAQTAAHTPLRVPAAAVAGIALAAALIGGILGSAFQLLNRPAAVGSAPMSARDQVVLQAGAEWEARYRQMYPEGGGISAPSMSARDRVVLQAGAEWETRYREMYPNSR